MILSSSVLVGIVWSFVIIALVFRFAYQPLQPRLKTSNITIINAKYLEGPFIFILIMLMAIVVRIWQFGEIPAGFNQDGAMAAVDAKALADYGTDRFGMQWPVQFTAWSYGQMSVMLSYLMIPFIKLGGLNEITARLPALLISIAGLLALYGLIRDVFGRTTALVVLLLAAINPWHIMQSRWAIDCNIFPHFFIIGCYFLNRARHSSRHLYFSMISFACCMYSYGISFFTVPLFLVAVAIYGWTYNIYKIKHILIGMSVYSVLALPVWLVMIINFLRWPTIETPIFTIAFFSESVRSGDILFFSSNFGEQLRTNFQSLLNTTFLQRPDLPWNALDKFGTQYLFALPLVLLGIAVSIVKCRVSPNNDANIAKKFGAFLVLGGLVVGLWTGIVIASVNVNRINIIYYFLIIMAGLGLVQLLRWIKPAFIATLIIYLFSFVLFCNHYFFIWSNEIGAYFFVGMGDALKRASQIDTPKYYVTVNSQFQGARDVSEILTLFHHKVDAKYFQGENFSDTDPRKSSATVAGNKYQLPYSQRYIYFRPETSAINFQESAVYIVNNNEIAHFNSSYFNIIESNGYALIVPKHMPLPAWN